MKSFLKFTFILMLALAIIALITGTALWHEVASHPDLTISINGENVPLDEMDAMHWVSGLFGIAVATLVILLVVPLVLLLGIGLPLLLVGGGLALALAAVAGVGVLVASPVIVLGLLVWVLVRGKRNDRRLRGNPDAATRQEPVA